MFKTFIHDLGSFSVLSIIPELLGEAIHHSLTTAVNVTIVHPGCQLKRWPTE